MTGHRETGTPLRARLVTYTTKPRGGPVHCLELAEALHRDGCDVHVFALGDPAEGFFRPVTAPHTIFPAPGPEGTLEERVQRALDALRCGLERQHYRDGDLLHAQDCIAGRAVVAIRDAGAPVVTVRTVHHVDDFTTAALIDCQRRSITEPDHVIVVSWFWQARLQEEFGVKTDVVTSGVDTDRLREFPPDQARTLRVFPSVNEGWGLALLEALAAGLPAVATDIPVFREFLNEHQALLVPPSDPAALSNAMLAAATDPALRRRLALAGRKVAERYTWDACARQHMALYEWFSTAARQRARAQGTRTTG
ncbi:MAG: glycosyltransferase [Streptosporangiaceae bacterium]